MIRKSLLALLAGAAIPAALAGAWAQTAARDDALQMVAIDVEGGGATLFVTPHGRSVLIDTANPDRGDHPNSETIEKAARSFGLTKIDYLITTHYHIDHIGGLEGVLKRIPIPAAALGSGDMAQVRIDVDQTFAPASLPGGGSDPRTLGIRVYHVYVDGR